MADEFTDNCFASDHVVQTDMANIEKNFAALKSAFSGAASPSSSDLVPGQWWYDTNNNILKLRVGSAWQSIWDFANNKPVITNLSNEITGAMISSTIKDPAAGTAGLRSIGTTGVTACAGNDSRLLNMTMTIGTNLVGCNHLETETNEDAYTIAKSFSIIQPGAYKVAFDIKSSYSGETVYGHIYRHDDTSSIAVGAEQSTSSTTYATKSQDISDWSTGDILELRIKAPSVHVDRTVLVKNFYLYVATANLGVPAAQDRV